jgi:hypothetical protein
VVSFSAELSLLAINLYWQSIQQSVLFDRVANPPAAALWVSCVPLVSCELMTILRIIRKIQKTKIEILLPTKKPAEGTEAFGGSVLQGFSFAS